MTEILGIDLGTTNSLIARWTEDGPAILPNALGAELTPSVVGLLDNGEIVVGEAAANRLITHPERTAAHFKRLMGTSQLAKLGAKSFRPEELSAFVLKALKRDAEKALDKEISDVVISVPAYFSDAQRQATRAAGELAGLSVRRLVNEPTAAALAHGLNDVEEGKYLVFDLGGGTFDVSIVERFDDIFEVRASAGDNFLGGEDFRGVVKSLITKQHEIETGSLDAAAHNVLSNAAERVKQALSTAREAEYEVSFAGRVLEGTLTREQFETESEELLRRLRKPLEIAIRDSDLSVDEIGEVVLVGGATRMPCVRSLVARLFRRLPLAGNDPDKTVAAGAAVQAGLVAEDKALNDVVVTDVCPHSLGIEVVRDGGRGMMMSFVIERNAVLPISRVEDYYTVENNQKELLVRVFQGESMRPEKNVFLGDVRVPVTPKPAGEESINVRFTYDVNGLLDVEVEVPSKDLKKQKLFETQESSLSDAEIGKRRAELEKYKLHPLEDAPNLALLARAERLYEEHTGDQRDAIGRLIREFEQEISDQTNRHPDKTREKFGRRLASFEDSPFRDESP